MNTMLTVTEWDWVRSWSSYMGEVRQPFLAEFVVPNPNHVNITK